MRRIVLPILGLFLSAALYVPAALATAKPAGACGFSQTNYVSAGATDAGGDNKSTDIAAYTDGCGNRQYRYSVWSQTGSSLNSVAVTSRVWICGSLVQQVHINASVYWTPWFNYGGCGPQADNAGSSGTNACSRFSCYNSNNFGIFYDHIN